MYLPNDLVKAVNAALSDRFELDESCFFIAATHTHFAPMLDAEKPQLGEVSDDYLDFVNQKICEKLTEILEGEFVKVSTSVGNIFSSAGLYRRSRILSPSKSFPFFKRKTATFPNYEEFRDGFPCTGIIFRDELGKVIGVLWSYPCHAVSHINKHNVSSDFPGYIRDQFRKSNDTDLSMVFLPGFCGDIRPKALNRKFKWPTAIIELLNLRRSFGQFSHKSADVWLKSLFVDFCKLFNAEEKLAPKSIQSALLKIDLDKIFQNLRQNNSLSVRVFLLGKSIALIGISAEVSYKYRELLKPLFPGRHIILTGYTDNVFGYLPTDSMIKEGGYEADTFKKPFSIEEASFQSNIESIIVEAVRQAAESIPSLDPH